jgi:hypothetical protein
MARRYAIGPAWNVCARGSPTAAHDPIAAAGWWALQGPSAEKISRMPEKLNKTDQKTR